MGGVEFIDRGPYVGDRWGRKRSARLFRLYGNINPEQVLSNPSSIALDGNGGTLPDYGSIWEGQKLEQYVITQTGTLIEATAVYTNDWFRPEVSVENVTRTASIPYAVKISTLTVGNVTRIFTWEEKSVTVSLACARFSMKVRVDKDEYLSGAAYVASQKGKIHKIKVGGTAGSSTPGGTDIYAQFDVGTVSQVTNSLMETTYSWITDPGNEYLNSPLPSQTEQGDDPQVQLAWPGRYQASGLAGDPKEYVRPPFTQLLMVKRAAPIGVFEAPIPSFRVFRPFVFDANGPLGLPGFDATAFLPVSIPGPGGGG